MPDVRDRAGVVFDLRFEAFKQAVAALLAEHSAKGLLQSGATIRRTVRSFEAEGQNAVDQLGAEVARTIESRGKAWRSAMVDMAEEFTAFSGRCRAEAHKTFDLAAKGRGSAFTAGDAEFDAAETRLRTRLSAFGDGWTAPPAKPWRERNATWYAIGLLAAGAVIGKFVDLMLEALR